MFDSELGHTKLQFDVMRNHAREALRVMDTYELEITDGDKEVLTHNFNEALETLDMLIKDVEEDMEVSYLNNKLNQ